MTGGSSLFGDTFVGLDSAASQFSGFNYTFASVNPLACLFGGWNMPSEGYHAYKVCGSTAGNAAATLFVVNGAIEGVVHG